LAWSLQMEKIKLIKVELHDLEQLQEIGRRTFWETFVAVNTEENMTKYLSEGFSNEKLGAEIRNKNSSFYFAKIGDTIIGYLKLNFNDAQNEMVGQNSLEIERIYVLKEFHGKKVGQLLYNQAIQIAKEKGVSFVWLGVWEENKRAIHFYEKNGFTAFDKHIFLLGEDAQTDILMKLLL